MTLRHATRIALLIAAMYAIAGHPGSDERPPADLKNLKVTNSEPTEIDICEPIKHDINQVMGAVGYGPLWQEMCRARLRASENDGLSSAVEVRDDQQGGTPK